MDVDRTKRIDTPEGRRYYPAIIAANGRAKTELGAGKRKA
jgi:hypothetical protein